MGFFRWPTSMCPIAGIFSRACCSAVVPPAFKASTAALRSPSVV